MQSKALHVFCGFFFDSVFGRLRSQDAAQICVVAVRLDRLSPFIFGKAILAVNETDRLTVFLEMADSFTPA